MITMNEKNGMKILVVDDEADVVTFVATLLEDNGYSVIKAQDGKEGFALTKAEHPDLIVLDINMPEETGVRMYRNLKENSQTSAIPVVMLTGVSHEFKHFIETRRQVPPPDGYFEKPPDRAEFLAKVNELVSRKTLSARVS